MSMSATERLVVELPSKLVKIVRDSVKSGGAVRLRDADEMFKRLRTRCLAMMADQDR
jgi:hypothetical protein